MTSLSLEANFRTLGNLINNSFAAKNKQFYLLGYPLFTFLFIHITKDVCGDIFLLFLQLCRHWQF